MVATPNGLSSVYALDHVVEEFHEEHAIVLILVH